MDNFDLGQQDQADLEFDESAVLQGRLSEPFTQSDCEAVLKAIPADVYVFSHIGISAGFWEKWEEFITGKISFSLDVETYHPQYPRGMQKVKVKKVSVLDQKNKIDDIAGGLRFDAKIRLISISPLPGNHSFVLDLGAVHLPETKPPEGLNKLLDDLKVLCEDRGIAKLGQNLQFDMIRLQNNFGWVVQNVRDIRVMSQLIYNMPEQLLKHNLKEIAKREIGQVLDKTEQDSDWGYGYKNNGLLNAEQYTYSGKDATIIWPCYESLYTKIIQENLQKAFKTEMAFTEVLVAMSFTGLYFDVEKAKKVREEYVKFHNKQGLIVAEFIAREGINIGKNGLTDKNLMAFINKKAELYKGKDYNIDQLALIDGDLGIDNSNYFIDEVLTSSATEILQDFFFEPGIKAFCEQLKARKLISALDSAISFSNGYGDGRIHTSFTQHLVASRTASREPNLQNIPNGMNIYDSMKDLPVIRSCFTAPPGYKFIVSDLSAAHARIAVQASQDRVLQDFFSNDKDIHLYTGSLVAKALGKDLTFESMSEIYKDKDHPRFKEVKKLRSMAKQVFYGCLNGSGYNTLRATIYDSCGEEITADEAKSILNEFHGGYPDLHNYQQKIIKESNANNVMFPFLTGKSFSKFRNIVGRIVHHPKESKFKDTKSNNDSVVESNKFNDSKSAKPNDIIAFAWMSPEADIMKQSAILTHSLFLKHPEWDAKLVNFVHDELNCYCREEYAEVVATQVIAIMNSCMAYVVRNIPPNDNENNDPKKAVCSSWDEK